MKKLLALVLLLPSIAFGQGWQVPYPAGTPRAFPTPGTVMTKANVNIYGDQRVTLVDGSGAGTSNTVNVVATPGATSFLKQEDSIAVTLDNLVAIAGQRNDGNATASRTNADGDYGTIAISDTGAVNTTLFANGNQQSAVKQEDNAAVGADGLVVSGFLREDILAANTSATNEWTYGKVNDVGSLYVDTVRRSAMLTTNPSVTNITSTIIASANTARRYLMIQNNSAANICVSLSGATLTGIIPSGTNNCFVILPNDAWISPPNGAPVSAATAYQASGGTINTISVVEQS